MNALIANLLARAHLDVQEEFGMIDTNRVAERFAVLIVKECSSVVERSYKYHTGTPISFWEMSQDVQRTLEDHFGLD